MSRSGPAGTNPRFFILAVLIAMLAILTACGLFSDDRPQFGDQAALQGEAFVVCSQECADRKQCGDASDGTRVVLIHNGDAPVVGGHNSFMPHGTPVLIGELRPEQLVQIVDNSEFTLNFYTVTNQELLRTGWVAGWCVADQLPGG